ncbi:MAG: hypothetical protein IKS31_08555 [Clostridia bacterium]|nr:hypothetical protein [Clostridia bacterium]
MNMLEGICGKVAPGLCRLSMGGGIAVKTRSGYRTYDVEENKLVNCDSFVLDVGEDFFFVVPTSRVKPGDIILSGGTPRCVISSENGTITALSFEDATVDTLVPERHMFMGSTYLYGKIVSIFGKGGVKGRKGTGRMMKYMMLSSLLKGRDGGQQGLAAMLMLGGGDGLMEDIFDSADDEDEKEA